MGLIIRSRTIGCRPNTVFGRPRPSTTFAFGVSSFPIHPLYKPGSALGIRVGGRQRSLGREGRSNDTPPISITLPSPDPPTAPPTVKFPSFLFSLHLSPPSPCVSLWIMSVPCIYFTSKFRIFSPFYMLPLN